MTYNQGVHGAQDTANAMVRAGRAVPRADRRLAKRDSFRADVGPLGAGRRRGDRVAVAEGRASSATR